jgi:hypothetical protein
MTPWARNGPVTAMQMASRRILNRRQQWRGQSGGVAERRGGVRRLVGDRSAVQLSRRGRGAGSGRVCSQFGYPATIHVDQGTAFVSRDLDLWAYTKGVVLDFSRSGKLTDNAFIEAFNGRFRAECLNAHWFMSLKMLGKRWRVGAGTTMRSARTARSSRKPRSHCSFVMACPAGHRDETRKL